MEHRQLGASGFMVPVLSFGTGTFGGEGAFKGFGESDAAEATRLVDICLDAGLTMFDSADAYSAGMAEEILGQAIKGRRDKVIISTKSAFRVGPGPNDVGSSRYHLIRAVEGSLSGSAPITSISISCTPSTRRRRSRRLSARSTTWSRPARFATSAARTSPAGT